jgi:uncharacterized membrane protein YhaH (DUF805 family)
MEDLFESCSARAGRNRATYWRSLVVFGVAGLVAAVLLLSAASLAAPRFIVTVVVVFMPWLMWRFAIHTERLRDRNKSAWWLVTFYLVPGILGHFAKTPWFAEAIGTAPQPILPLVAFALSIWGFVEIGCLPGIAGPNRYGPIPVAKSSGGTARPGFSIPLTSAEGDKIYRAPPEAATQQLKRWPS